MDEKFSLVGIHPCYVLFGIPIKKTPKSLIDVRSIRRTKRDGNVRGKRASVAAAAFAVIIGVVVGSGCDGCGSGGGGGGGNAAGSSSSNPPS
ncbi:hypothetical protein M0804_011606 [Polistes exclamans]|nr:hypothetical protein M0804_011606 [Polistes exclamans]